MTCAYCGKHKPHGNCPDNCAEVAMKAAQEKAAKLLERIADAIESIEGIKPRKAWWQFWK